MIYLDADTLVLTDIKNMWSEFKKFQREQMIGVTQETEDPSVSYYQKELPYPYYGPTGVNTGVCLLNLTRMRMSDFESHIFEIYKSFRSMRLKFGDQCLVNIYLSQYPGNGIQLDLIYIKLIISRAIRKSLFVKLCVELSGRSVSS